MFLGYGLKTWEGKGAPYPPDAPMCDCACPVQARNAFLGYGPEVEGGQVSHCVMELAFQEGVRSYRIGSGFLGFGIRAGAQGAASHCVRARA